MIYQGREQVIPKLIDPTLLFWVILGLVILIQIFYSTSTFRRVLAFTFLIFAGIVGWILTFMWFGTDHYMTKWNYNLLWAMPIYFPLAIFFFKAEKFKLIQLLIQVSKLILILLLLLWTFNPQQFHSAIIPIILILIWSLSEFLPFPKTAKTTIS